MKGAREIKETFVDTSKWPANKKGTKGMAIIIDPRVNTNGEEYIIRLHYEVLQERADFPNIMDKVTKMTDFVVCGNGKSYNIKFIASFSQSEQNSNDDDLDSIDISLPGWNGKHPIFIPAEICQCELICPVSSLHNFELSYKKVTRSVKSAPVRMNSSSGKRATSSSLKNITMNQVPNLGTRPKSSGLYNSLSTNKLAPCIPQSK